jgi:hypothetical protein
MVRTYRQLVHVGGQRVSPERAYQWIWSINGSYISTEWVYQQIGFHLIHILMTDSVSFDTHIDDSFFSKVKEMKTESKEGALLKTQESIKRGHEEGPGRPGKGPRNIVKVPYLGPMGAWEGDRGRSS